MPESFNITIDENALDAEWLRQPRLYHQMATQLADAQKVLAESKAELEVTKAEVSLDIRKHPDRYGLPKVTEDTVSSCVLTTTQYQRAQQAAIDAKHDVDVLNAAVYSLDHRKRALENLVSLYVSDYYSTPKSRNSGEEVEWNKQARRKGKSREPR